jgi:hypothetical protein
VSGVLLLTRLFLFWEVGVGNDLTTFSIDWLANDSAVARRALAGEPITILQREPFYDKIGIRRHLGKDGVAQFVDNWNHRLTRGIRRQNIAIDEEHKGPAIGWYTEILPGENGVAARMAWNSNGRRLLEQGGYAYFSPAVAWKMRDKETNKWVYNQIVGGGVCNDPYLGETTALMRRGLSFRKGGFLMDDDNAGNPQDELGPTLRGLRRFFSGLGQADPPGAAPPGGDTAPADLSKLTQQLDELRQQVDKATGSISTLTTERDSALEQVQTLVGRVSTVEQARLVEQFRGMVTARFSHLPGTTDQLADQMLWLFSRDAPSVEGETTRPHYDFFSTLLAKADGVYKTAFTNKGANIPVPGSIVERVNGMIAKYRQANKDASEEDAMSAVFAANPAMYGEYLTQVDNEAGVQ